MDVALEESKFLPSEHSRQISSDVCYNGEDGKPKTAPPF